MNVYPSVSHPAEAPDRSFSAFLFHAPDSYAIPDATATAVPSPSVRFQTNGSTDRLLACCAKTASRDRETIIILQAIFGTR
jgi:hypothetical protein